jgi:hypothetical protein
MSTDRRPTEPQHPSWRLCLVIGLLWCPLALSCDRAAVGGPGDDGGASDAVAPDAGDADAGDADANAADGGTADGGGLLCEGLTLSECRLRDGCVADTCFICTCAPVFEQCRRAAEPVFECPQLGCAQPLCCQEESQCQAMNGQCAAPGAPFVCGMCNPETGDCGADSDCGNGDICEPIPCSCQGESACVAGCGTGTDCDPGLVCSGGAHPRCVPAVCSASQPCPPNFDCQVGQCARRVCSDDLLCDGYCVEGRCYDALGECLPMAP